MASISISLVELELRNTPYPFVDLITRSGYSPLSYMQYWMVRFHLTIQYCMESIPIGLLDGQRVKNSRCVLCPGKYGSIPAVLNCLAVVYIRTESLFGLQHLPVYII